jgi:hypothetical protein
MYFFMIGTGMRGLGSGLLIAASLAICSAQILPNYPEGAAKVISLVGQVSVLRETVPWVLNVGDSVQARQVIVTGPDGYAVFQVSDGSTFQVYPNSNVVFRKNPPNWGDLLDLLAGRVRIHIQKLGEKPNPNRILTPTAVISVRGTTFDVSVNDEDEATLVEVEEGVVDVNHALMPGVTKTLNAGESLHVYRDQPLAQSLVDKGALAQRILRSLADAAFMLTNPMRGISIPGKGPGGGGLCPGCSGQGGRVPPPPAPPPPGTPGSPASSPPPAPPPPPPGH